MSIVSTEDAFLSLKSAWESLYAECDGMTVYQSFTWNYYWWKHFRSKGTLAVVVVLEESIVVGIAPFMTRPRLGVVEVQPLGSLQYMGMLFRAHREDVAEAIAENLIGIMGKGIFHIPSYAVGNYAFECLAASLAARGWHEARWARAVSYYVHETEGYCHYLSCKSAKTRGNMRRDRQKLEKDNVVTIGHYEGIQISRGLLERLENIQKNSWLVRRGQESVNSYFMADIVPVLAEENAVEVFILSLGAQDVAYILNLRSGRETYCAYIAFDERFSSLSPGKTLMSVCLSTALDRGDVVYDFLFGEGEYKRFWSNRKRRVLRGVYYKGIYGWLLSWFPHRMHGRLSRYKWMRPAFVKLRRLTRLRSSKDVQVL